MNSKTSATHADPEEKFSSFYTEVLKPHNLTISTNFGMFTGERNRKTGLCPNSHTTN